MAWRQPLEDRERPGKGLPGPLALAEGDEQVVHRTKSTEQMSAHVACKLNI
jgi:hypothetical protein